jgi:hypothetical protein
MAKKKGAALPIRMIIMLNVCQEVQALTASHYAVSTANVTICPLPRSKTLWLL